MQNQKAFGALYSSNHSGSICKANFIKASTASTAVGGTGEYIAYNIKPVKCAGTDAALYAAWALYSNANKWYQVLDLEIINNLKETLYTGISTKGSTNTLRLNIDRPLSNATHAIHFYSCFDIILEFDYTNQVINVIQ